MAPVCAGVLEPCRNLLAILDADLTSSPQPPHLKEFLDERTSKDDSTEAVGKEEDMEEVEEIKAEGEGGSLLGGVAQEQAAKLPKAHPFAKRHTAAAADIA